MSELDLTQLDTVTAITGNATALYASKTSGLYQSNDAGQSWQRITDKTQTGESPVTALAVQNTTILAGLFGGILRTDDAGENWQVIAIAAPPPLVSSIVMSPDYDNDGTAFAGTTEDGVFVSNDHGKSWISWNFGLIDLDIYCLALSPDFGHDSTIYAGTEIGIYVSQNTGKSWHDLPFPTESAPVLSIAITDDGKIFAGTEGNGLFISADNGQNWSPLPDITGDTIHNIHIIDGQVFVLTDQYLWEIHPSNLTSSSLKTFDDVQPLSLGRADNRWLVGTIDGRIDIV